MNINQFRPFLFLTLLFFTSISVAKERSQIIVTDTIASFASRLPDINEPKNLIVIRDSILKSLTFYPVDSRAAARAERRIRWRRTADHIVQFWVYPIYLKDRKYTRYL